MAIILLSHMYHSRSGALGGFLPLLFLSTAIVTIIAGYALSSDNSATQKTPAAVTVSDETTNGFEDSGSAFERAAVGELASATRQEPRRQTLRKQTFEKSTSIYAVQTDLSAARMDLIDAELGDTEGLIRDHSFAVNLSRLGVVDFVPSDVREERKLALRWRDMNGNYIPLFLSDRWNFKDLEAVAFEDINEDGLGPDIVAIAQYYTGIGPDGARPFSSPIVLVNDGRDNFDIDPAIESILRESNATTIDGVRTILNAAGESVLLRSLSDLNAETYRQLKASGQFCDGYYDCAYSQRDYAFEDGILLSELSEFRLEVALIPDVPISREVAIAYGHILASDTNLRFTEIGRADASELSETYFPNSPTGGSIPHTGYSLRLDLNNDESVSKITFSRVTL